MAPFGYAHGGGIATSSIYTYTVVLYLALSTVFNMKTHLILSVGLKSTQLCSTIVVSNSDLVSSGE